MSDTWETFKELFQKSGSIGWESTANSAFKAVKRSPDQTFITGICSVSPSLGVKIIHFVDRRDLFKISNLV